jgi:hypothetical protein
MSVNFNDAPEQKEQTGAIPAKSVIWAKLHIREATKSNQTKSDKHPLMIVSKSNSANHYFDCEFEVKSPSFDGRKIWTNFVVVGNEKAVNISMAFFRAAIEAARGISPDDASQAATTARQLNDWAELQGLTFPVMVGIEPPKAGDQYINNKVVKVITPDKPEYAEAKEKGEIITDNPLPVIPAGGGTAPSSTGYAAPGAETTKPAPSSTDDVPAWAK